MFWLWHIVAVLLTFASAVALVLLGRDKGMTRLVWPLGLTLLLVCTLEALVPDLQMGRWLPAAAAAVLGIVVGLILPRWSSGGEEERSWVGRPLKLWRNAASDYRVSIIGVAVLIALILTYPLAKLGFSSPRSEFWFNFYIAWTVSLLFFALVGAAGTLVTLYRPEMDEFRNRVRILFDGRQDLPLDYLSDRIKAIGYYYESIERTYTFTEYDPGRNAIRIRVEHTSLTGNFYSDIPMSDKVDIKLKSDVLTPPLSPMGYLRSFEVAGADLVTEPEPFEGGVEFKRTAPLDIPKGGKARVKVVHEGWYDLGVVHEWALARFAKRISITLVYGGDIPRHFLPVEYQIVGGQTETLRLPYNRAHAVRPITDRLPDETVFTFRISPPAT